MTSLKSRTPTGCLDPPSNFLGSRCHGFTTTDHVASTIATGGTGVSSDRCAPSWPEAVDGQGGSNPNPARARISHHRERFRSKD
jgi:hypothetical protein